MARRRTGRRRRGRSAGDRARSATSLDRRRRGGRRHRSPAGFRQPKQGRSRARRSSRTGMQLPTPRPGISATRGQGRKANGERATRLMSSAHRGGPHLHAPPTAVAPERRQLTTDGGSGPEGQNVPGGAVMANAASAIANKPAWVDLGTTDTAAASRFYSTLFGWDVQVNPDPQYGGYGRATLDGKDVAGIGPTMSPQQPVAWSVYIGTDDAEALGRKVEAAGGRVLMPAFDVGDQGRMAVFADPGGASISAWQPTATQGFETEGANAFSWAELNARNVGTSLPFYRDVFGWALHTSDSPDMPYTEFKIDGQSIAGATEMSPMAPGEMPNYWLVYFGGEDVDASTATAVKAGGKEMLAPMDFPGGRMSMIQDPQGAIFGLLRLADTYIG